MRPPFWPKDKILVNLDSRYGIRGALELIASTQFAKVKSELLIALLSFSRSVPFSVRRLSSDPARSMQLARLTSMVVSVV